MAEIDWPLNPNIGNIQPLIDIVNSSNLPFMDSSAKNRLI
jgi:hypothetical protein